MGWMDWERFRCNTNCANDPENCIGEVLIKGIADMMAANGYRDAGYLYVDIDDCWLTKSRDGSGNLVPNPVGFPSGMKALAEYIHTKGLLFGMYEDIGTETCGGFPGSEGHFAQDAQTFSSWGVDALKLDGCYYQAGNYETGYTQYSQALNSTGRKIMFSCSWPAYINDAEKAKYYPYIAKICNIWRNWADIQNSYTSMASIANYWGDHSAVLSAVAKPGSWNDADQLIIGNTGLNQAESESQMALWAVMASPLIMSNDLRNITTWARDILINKEVIAVNQDKLGRQGGRIVGSAGKPQVWHRELSDSSYAVVLWNDTPASVSIMADLSFVSGTATVRDLFQHKDLGKFNGNYTATGIPAHGCVMVKVIPSM
jgi:alpha-N-acetylgalactosaminidase